MEQYRFPEGEEKDRETEKVLKKIMAEIFQIC